MYLFTYDNFVPNDVFRKDKENNDIYFMFGKFSSGHIVSDSKTKSNLISLEGYKYFLFPSMNNPYSIKQGFSSIIPPVLYLIILIPFFFIVILSIPFEHELANTSILELNLASSLTLYILALIFYFLKIKFSLKTCSLISKEEKEWIFLQDSTHEIKKDFIIQEVDKKTMKEQEEENKGLGFVLGVICSLLLLISFAPMLIDGLVTGYIDVSFKEMRHTISYVDEPAQFIFAIAFLSSSMLYIIYTFSKNIKPCIVVIKTRLKPRYIFYAISFFIISFPLWFFLYAIIFQ